MSDTPPEPVCNRGRGTRFQKCCQATTVLVSARLCLELGHPWHGLGLTRRVVQRYPSLSHHLIFTGGLADWRRAAGFTHAGA